MIKYLVLFLGLNACAPAVQKLTLEQQWQIYYQGYCFAALKSNNQLERYPECLEMFASATAEYSKIMKVQDILNAK